MEGTFDPLNLDNRAGLNRMRLAGHEAIPSELRDKQGWDLLSVQAMRREVVRYLPDLGADGDDPLIALDKALGAGDQDSGELAARFGSYLGYLVLVLTSASKPSTSHQRYWSSIRNVWLGGGIVRGNLGVAMLAEARRVLDLAGRQDLGLEIAPHPQSLPLIGAARSVDAEAPSALVFDFGSTDVKRSVASYAAGVLTALRRGPSIATQGLPDEIGGTTDPEVAKRLADFMTALVVDGWHDATQAGLRPARGVVASVACYLRDGQPLAYDAGYASLRLLSDNAARFLSDVVSQKVGAEVEVTLLHDGTTAARVFAGQPHTAVIMMGTWLGVGFAPEDAPALRPLAPGFTVESA